MQMNLNLSSLTSRNRHFLAVAGIVPIMLLAGAGYSAIQGVSDLVTLHRAEGFAALGNDTSVLRQERLSRTLAFQGATRSLASAAFENRVSDVLLTNRLVQTSMEIVPSDGNAIAVGVSFTGTLAGLRRALFTLETGTPLVFVKTIAIERQDQLPSQAAGQSAVPLSVRMTLEAAAHEEATR